MSPARRRRLVHLLMALVAVTLYRDLPAQSIAWSGAVSHALGRYQFAETFRTWTFANTLTLGGGGATVSLTLPVVAQDGGVVSRVGGTTLPTGGPDAGAVRRRGPGQPVATRPGRRGRATSAAMLSTVVEDDSITVAGAGAMQVQVADPLVSAAYDLYAGTGVVRVVGVNAAIKPPLASVASGVGTGAWDAGAGASLVLGVGGTLVFADATWWHLGDLPDLPLRDAVFGSVSVGRVLGRDWSLLGSLSGASRVIATSEPPWSATVTATRFLPAERSVSLMVGTGLTETAADLFVSVGWRVPLRR